MYRELENSAIGTHLGHRAQQCMLTYTTRGVMAESLSTHSMMGEPPSKANVLVSVPTEVYLVQSEDRQVLIQNLRASVNNPECSDVQFVCSDGGRVYACRGMLVARSSVLKSLLTNGMSESRLTEIPLPHITTPAICMLTTVEYLYTGTIVQNNCKLALTLVSAFQTLHASRFLMLQNLEECVMHILVATVKERLQGTDINVEFLIWCFMQFAAVVDTPEKPVLGMVNLGAAGLVRDMASKLEAMDTDFLNKLCVHAFDLYLAPTPSSKQGTVSLKKYLRLRRILLWACTRVSLLAEEVLRVSLPDEKDLSGAFKTLRESFVGRNKFVKTGTDSPLEPFVVKELHTWVEKMESRWSSGPSMHPPTYIGGNP